MDGDSHFISFQKLVSRTVKLLLLSNWPIESWTAVYNEVNSNISDQRIILAYFGLISCYNLVAIYCQLTYVSGLSTYMQVGNDIKIDKQLRNKSLVSLICMCQILIFPFTHHTKTAHKKSTITFW